jgi:hypothetical protein
MPRDSRPVIRDGEMNFSVLELHLNIDLRWFDRVLYGIVEKVSDQNFDIHTMREDFAWSDVPPNGIVR